MKLRARAGTIIAISFSLALCSPLTAYAGLPESFVVEDLQLISLSSVPDWENDWEYSRAVAAATVLAWLHGRGYALLLDDLNDDGVIDELDTIELADWLGKGAMGCQEPRSPTDPWLVVGLAEYVAARYPGGFELRIYDPGFPEEFEEKTGRPFGPDAIPGIALTLEPQPTVGAYMRELVDRAGVIVGLEETTGRNLYFTGRSFLRDPIGPDTYVIDLAWPEEDWFRPGTQGKVLETRARQTTDGLYVDYQGRWLLAESMFALAPLVPPTADGTPENGPTEGCPDLEVQIVRHACSCEPRPVYEEQCVEWSYVAYPPICIAWDTVIVGYTSECTVAVYFKVRNIGDEDAGKFRVRVQSSTGHSAVAMFWDGLAAGEEEMRSVSFTFEGPGAVTVTVIADDQNEVDECDEGNNTDQKTIHCR